MKIERELKYLTIIGGLSFIGLGLGKIMTSEAEQFSIDVLRDCRQQSRFEVVINRALPVPLVVLIEDSKGNNRFLTPVTNKKTGNYEIVLQDKTIKTENESSIDLTDQNPITLSAFRDFIEESKPKSILKSTPSGNTDFFDGDFYDGLQGLDGNPYIDPKVQDQFLRSELLARTVSYCNF